MVSELENRRRCTIIASNIQYELATVVISHESIQASLLGEAGGVSCQCCEDRRNRFDPKNSKIVPIVDVALLSRVGPEVNHAARSSQSLVDTAIVPPAPNFACQTL